MEYNPKKERKTMVVSYETKAYSRGRSTVMGLATLMILWFHCSVIVPPESILGYSKMVGDLGVDLFFFASGVGIFFAVQKHESYRAYLTSRMLRILPAFLLATALWSLYRKNCYWEFDTSGLWLELTTLNFWLHNDLTCWYVAGTLVLYLLTPGYIRLWKKYPWFHAAGIGGILILGALSHQIPQLYPLQRKLIFFFRIPVYLMGLQMGKWIREGKQLRIFWPALLAAAAGCVFVVASCHGYTAAVIPWGYKYAAYGPLAVILSLLAAKLPENCVTAYFAVRSLEVYLVFEKVLEAIDMRPQMEILDGDTRIMKNLLALAVTLVLVEMLKAVCSLPGKLLKTLQKASA